MAMGVGCLRIKEAREAMRCLDKQITPPSEKASTSQSFQKT